MPEITGLHNLTPHPIVVYSQYTPSTISPSDHDPIATIAPSERFPTARLTVTERTEWVAVGIPVTDTYYSPAGAGLLPEPDLHPDGSPRIGLIVSLPFALAGLNVPRHDLLVPYGEVRERHTGRILGCRGLGRPIADDAAPPGFDLRTPAEKGLEQRCPSVTGPGVQCVMGDNAGDHDNNLHCTPYRTWPVTPAERNRWTQVDR